MSIERIFHHKFLQNKFHQSSIQSSGYSKVNFHPQINLFPLTILVFT